MPRRPYERDNSPPPDFDHARNPRQRARAAGLDPNHWYAVALEGDLAPGTSTPITFWHREIALFRTEDGAIHAVENRCAHRQLPLTAGQVEGCHLVCPYHGWAYDGEGRVASIPHETFGKENLRFRVASFPTQVRYGLVWIFPGDAHLADHVAMPAIPELDGDEPWLAVPVRYQWAAHHSMVFDNVSDYTHGYLHRRTEPFRDPKLLAVEPSDDAVVVVYDTKIGAGWMMDPFIHRNELGSNTITLTYDYPYHRSDADGEIKHFISVLPHDEGHTTAFMIFLYRSIRVPFTSWSMPRPLMRAAIRFANRFLVDAVMSEDGEALELEQQAWERHWQAPMAELNPQVLAFQKLTIAKWQAYLERQRVPARAMP